MADWPGTLPQGFLQKTYKEFLPDLVLTFKPDFGPPLTRKRGEANIRPFSGDMHLTESQLVILDAFWLANCALVFNFPNPRGGGMLAVTFQGPPQLVDTGSWQGGEYLYKVSLALAEEP